MYTVPASVLGLRVSGDLGGTTIYTDKKGQKTVYPFAPPKEPASIGQITCRERFRNAQAAWRALTADQKRDLETAVNFASLCMTGQNVFVSAILTSRAAALKTLCDQAGVACPPVPTVNPL